MDCSTPVFPVHHQLPELAQSYAHRVGDAILVYLEEDVLFYLEEDYFIPIEKHSQDGDNSFNSGWNYFYTFTFFILPITLQQQFFYCYRVHLTNLSISIRM